MEERKNKPVWLKQSDRRGLIKMTDWGHHEIWEPGQKANPGERHNGDQVRKEREELDC